ncbi:L-glyceraldehyde 3-phosphate reductase [Formosa algae]|uniref:L-glyceraldehyde 3-phosphate reductase n=2 Tax=Formosa algae TaxID=225843 RepID=A0A9X0YHE2_9FLAO|nr:L-glyceraldehyde 3-phosphate reductase [Formosa algae]MBP1838314.1 L-glyceraldehyde 3-phosphate reductase [Formosa algae]MDQ0334449.1 L-glyceraldehyde 3-phosphate reductase [Formosa algae]OEI82148.1 L-glyceraldehyde 3-phosphate reductase [Formosa algae]
MYQANSDRYNTMPYRRCGKSGLVLPPLSLGLWHNFGDVDKLSNGKQMLHTAFDKGITHFDLANNYGPPPGSAESNFGSIFKESFVPYRDELIISTKAGYRMWPGPYGEWGSKKYLVSSLDQSLQRMGLDYVDVFYHHRPDPNTPLEETMAALDLIVRQGKALYVGISNYNAEDTLKASRILKDLGTPCLIHQPRYNMMDRWVEDGLLEVLGDEGIGAIAFSPLQQGILTSKYLKGIPEQSRAAKSTGFLQKETITKAVLAQVTQLNAIAEKRNQSLAQMAVAWLLKDDRITSVLVGVSSESQLLDNLGALDNLEFSASELEAIESVLQS